jgi:hypothetical protein
VPEPELLEAPLLLFCDGEYEGVEVRPEELLSPHDLERLFCVFDLLSNVLFEEFVRCERL